MTQWIKRRHKSDSDVDSFDVQQGTFSSPHRFPLWRDRNKKLKRCNVNNMSICALKRETRWIFYFSRQWERKNVNSQTRTLVRNFRRAQNSKFISILHVSCLNFLQSKLSYWTRKTGVELFAHCIFINAWKSKKFFPFFLHFAWLKQTT